MSGMSLDASDLAAIKNALDALDSLPEGSFDGVMDIRSHKIAIDFDGEVHAISGAVLG